MLGVGGGAADHFLENRVRGVGLGVGDLADRGPQPVVAEGGLAVGASRLVGVALGAAPGGDLVEPSATASTAPDAP